MFKPVTPMDEAELALEFRKTYKERGFWGMMQVYYEMLKALEICCRVIQEEWRAESDSKKPQ